MCFSFIKIETPNIKTAQELADFLNRPIDEIVKTINLSQEMDGKEWLKITGAKIWLTDETRIDDAIIQDAMIGNLSASKLTAGTINASDVNIINLNASNISTGTLKAINIEGVNIKGSKFTSLGDDFIMEHNNGAIVWKRIGDEKEVFKLYTTIMNMNEGNARLEVSDSGSLSVFNKKLNKAYFTFYGTTNNMSGT